MAARMLSDTQRYYGESGVPEHSRSNFRLATCRRSRGCHCSATARSGSRRDRDSDRALTLRLPTHVLVLKDSESPLGRNASLTNQKQHGRRISCCHVPLFGSPRSVCNANLTESFSWPDVDSDSLAATQPTVTVVAAWPSRPSRSRQY